MKPPSSWRNTANSGKAANENPAATRPTGGSVRPENRKGRFQQDEQPIGGLGQKPRASSLNPLIYPSWWGEDSDFEKEIKRDRSNDAGKGGQINIERVSNQNKMPLSKL
jgi:hypothetical protein